MACPICQRKADPKLRPFCSKRCADIDLAKWLSGSYGIPSDDPEDIEEAVIQTEEALRRRPH